MDDSLVVPDVVDSSVEESIEPILLEEQPDTVEEIPVAKTRRKKEIQVVEEFTLINEEEYRTMKDASGGIRMAYKVDKKKFDEKLLEEQLRSVELQKKYLKDEPLKRSEVDEYNKLQANGWIKNTLISLGVTFATAIAVVVFVLLGNMLFTNGRTGNVGAYNLNSSDIVAQVKRDLGDELFEQPTMLGDL